MTSYLQAVAKSLAQIDIRLPVMLAKTYLRFFLLCAKHALQNNVIHYIIDCMDS